MKNKILIIINLMLIISIYGVWNNYLSKPKTPTIAVQVANTQSYEVDLCGLDTVVCDNELTNQVVYGYSSEESQTDSSPFITANGGTVHDTGIANNCRPFGTRVRIAGKTFTVNDRMNSRYGCEVYDIWFPSKQEALNHGKQITSVTIL